MTDKQKKLEKKRKKVLYGRLHILWLSVFFLFVLLMLKISAVQLVDGDKYARLAEDLNIKELPIIAPRGAIYDRSGKPLVTNEPIFAAVYIETNHDDKKKIDLAKRLAKLFGMKPSEVMEAMDIGVDIKGKERQPKQPPYVPRKIKDRLTEDQVAKIRERPHDFPGVNVIYEPVRVFRDDTIAVQTIGYVRSFAGSQQIKKYKEIKAKDPKAYLDWEQVGYDGIELSYQDELRGKHGSRLVRVDKSGKITQELEQTNPEIGNSLYLNIDETIQLKGEEFVEQHLRYLRSWSAGRKYSPHAKNAYAVLMEVKTGKVRAMISYPDYDPNIWKQNVPNQLFKKELNYVMNNGTIFPTPHDVRSASNPEEEVHRHPQSVLPMGSTYKPLNILMMLNEGIISPWTDYYDRGILYYARSTPPIRNSGGHGYGYLNPRTALQKSSNVYMAWTANILYNKTGGEKGNSLDILSKYNKMFGLFTKTGVDLPRESTGTEDYKQMVKNNSSVQGALVLSSFGQTERPTTLQLAQFVATIANDGVRMQPQLVDKIVDADGNVVKKIKPKVMSKANIPKEYFRTVQEGMKLVTSPGGTASQLFHKLPYKVAAKTGTSEQDIPISYNGKFSHMKRVENAVMVAYYPANDPKVAAAVVVPEGGFGSQGAGPIVEKLFELYHEQFMKK